MARPKLGSSETERLHVKITADEIKAIDDWRYENRVPSRSEAVRRLVQLGLRTIDHLQGLADQSSAMTQKAQSIEEQWTEILLAPDCQEDLAIYAAKASILFSEEFSRLADEVFDCHNRLVDFVHETNAIQQGADVNDAIEAADRIKAEAIEQRKRWEKQVAEWKLSQEAKLLEEEEDTSTPWKGEE